MDRTRWGELEEEEYEEEVEEEEEQAEEEEAQLPEVPLEETRGRGKVDMSGTLYALAALGRGCSCFHVLCPRPLLANPVFSPLLTLPVARTTGAQSVNTITGLETPDVNMEIRKKGRADADEEDRSLYKVLEEKKVPFAPRLPHCVCCVLFLSLAVVRGSFCVSVVCELCK